MEKNLMAFDTESEEYIKLSPKECIYKMLKATNGGKLYIPAWPYDNDTESVRKIYEITSGWTEEDAKNLIREFEELNKSLKAIAKIWDGVEITEDAKNLLSEGELSVFETYVKPHSVNDAKYDAVPDIEERLEENDDSQSVSEEEKALCREYYDRIHEELGSRIGGGLASYDVVIRAARLCRLYSLKAPAVVTNNEAKLLIQAMMVHEFAEELGEIKEQ